MNPQQNHDLQQQQLYDNQGNVLDNPVTDVIIPPEPHELEDTNEFDDVIYIY